MAKRTIFLKGRGIPKEALAAAGITPGHLVYRNADGKFAVHAVAGERTSPIFARENELDGKDIDHAYLANEQVLAEAMPPGAEVYALVAANAPAILAGDLLESAGDGTLRKVVLLTGTLTGTPDGALEDITFNSTWSSAQANEINVNFEELQAKLNAMKASAIARALENVDNSAVAAVARIQVEVL